MATAVRKDWRSSGECAKRAQSSAYCISRAIDSLVVACSLLKWKTVPSSLNSTARPLVDSSYLWRRWLTHMRKTLKSTGANTHSCFTPVSTGKDVHSLPPMVTRAINPLGNWPWMLTNLGGQSNLASALHKSSLFTVSEATEKSMNNRHRSWCCSWHFSWSWRVVNIALTVLLFLRNCTVTQVIFLLPWY